MNREYDRLSCTAITKSFDGVQALQCLDLTFPLAGVVAVVGPNGAGKTTLFNIITGFVSPDAGKVLLGDRDITRMQPCAIAKLGITRTFQDVRLIAQLSALENVELARPNQRGEKLVYALSRRGVAREEASNANASMELLRFVGLEDVCKEQAGELSYGQQKLLTLASCLATEARVLLLDEPVAGVFPQVADQVLNLLLKLKEQRKLVVFIEHDLSAVRRVADTVIVMEGGRVIATGTPAKVLAQPEIMEAYIG